MVNSNEFTTVKVFKAEPIGSSIVPNLVLVVDDELPIKELRASTESLRAFFRDQAHTVLQALLMSLPGGTISALTVELLQHEISVRIITDMILPEKPGIDE